MVILIIFPVILHTDIKVIMLSIRGQGYRGSQIVVGKRCTAKAAFDYPASYILLKHLVKTNLWQHTKFCMARKKYK